MAHFDILNQVMKIVLLIIEIISGLLLIGAILIHAPKSQGMGAIGGESRMIKSSEDDMQSGLRRITTAIAVCFFGSAVMLGLFF